MCKPLNFYQNDSPIIFILTTIPKSSNYAWNASPGRIKAKPLNNQSAT